MRRKSTRDRDREIIGEFYGIDPKSITDAEVDAEIANLIRKSRLGYLDDVVSGPLASRLGID